MIVCTQKASNCQTRRSTHDLSKNEMFYTTKSVLGSIYVGDKFVMLMTELKLTNVDPFGDSAEAKQMQKHTIFEIILKFILC